jgi:hypothetical protein
MMLPLTGISDFNAISTREHRPPRFLAQAWVTVAMVGWQSEGISPFEVRGEVEQPPGFK